MWSDVFYRLMFITPAPQRETAEPSRSTRPRSCCSKIVTNTSVESSGESHHRRRTQVSPKTEEFRLTVYTSCSFHNKTKTKQICLFHISSFHQSLLLICGICVVLGMFYRFRHGYCKGNPRKMVRTWAEKEMRNLIRSELVITLL